MLTLPWIMVAMPGRQLAVPFAMLWLTRMMVKVDFTLRKVAWTLVGFPGAHLAERYVVRSW